MLEEPVCIFPQISRYSKLAYRGMSESGLRRQAPKLSSLKQRTASLTIIRTGDMLLSIEAMKMETSINAGRDGTITRLHTTAGTQIEAKDLLMEIDSGSMN